MNLLDLKDSTIGDDGLKDISSCLNNINNLIIGSEYDKTVTMVGITALSTAIQNREQQVSIDIKHVMVKTRTKYLNFKK